MDLSIYTVAWICALPIEMAAARAMLDVDRGTPPQGKVTERNSYRLGQIGGHDIVLACLPSGVYGSTSATSVAVQLLNNFPGVRFGLLVGIGGGAPSELADIRLGDVVISKPSLQFGGVVAYDVGKLLSGEFIPVGSPNKPPPILLTAIASMEAQHMLGENRILEFLDTAARRYPRIRQDFCQPPNTKTDLLFTSDCLCTTLRMGTEGRTCEDCDMSRVQERPFRDPQGPQIHYGLIASGNQVIKDATFRDELAREKGVLCFEMEAAGLMDHVPSLVIRGISDYADSHKNGRWKKYAAMTAAAVAKELLVDAVMKVTPNQQENSNISSPLNPRLSQERSVFSGNNFVGSGRLYQIGNIASGGGVVHLG